MKSLAVFSTATILLAKYCHGASANRARGVRGDHLSVGYMPFNWCEWCGAVDQGISEAIPKYTVVRTGVTGHLSN